MKKRKQDLAKSFILFLSLLVFLSSAGLAADRAMLAVSGGYLFPADSGFKEVYGQKVLVPEFKFGIRVISDIYIFATFSTFSRNGLTPDLQEPAKARQQFLGGGLAYFPDLSRHWKVFLGAAAISVNYREEAMELEISGSKIGLAVEGGIYFREKYVFLGVNGGYCSARDSYEGAEFKMGGARASLALGFIF